MSKEYIKAQTPLPTYFPYPKFLLQMSLSHTARSIPIESFLIGCTLSICHCSFWQQVGYMERICSRSSVVAVKIIFLLNLWWSVFTAFP